MSLSPGDRLGSYEIVAPLGSGGMGVVYRARDPKLGRDVAIKILSADGASDPERLKRFEQEARAASALDHPNIITIHEIGETDDGQPFLVMQLVDGKSVREVIASRRLNLKDALSIAIQVADGLSRAHGRGIVHRDLKPDNIMVNADGLVKLLDFGLAKLSEPAVGSELATVDREKPQTQEGRIVGTAHYMSPEQAQGESVDARSDIFSFGAVIYEMVTGRRAFQGGSTVSVLAEIVGKDPERLSAIDPSLPMDLDKIVHRALRKDPERRFQNASDMKVALTELAEELESGDALTASDVRAVARPKRRWWPVAAALGLAAGAIAIASSLIPTDLPPMRIVPLTTDTGYEDEPALSPDGQQLAYVKDGHIFVKLIGEGEAVALTSGDVDDASPAWSPDGTRVAFLRHRGDLDHHDVLEVPAVGGTPRRLGRADGGHGIAYSPDGREIVVSHREPSDASDALFVIDRDTGDAHRVTSPPAEVHDRFPRFSPDGGSVAFMRVSSGLLRFGDILVHDFSDGSERELSSEHGVLTWLDFSRDGRYVVYSVGQSLVTFHLAATPVGGGSSRALLPGEHAANPATARTTDRLAYVRSLDDVNIWRVSGPAAETPSPPEPVIASTRLDNDPAISPDGSKLLFTSDRSGAAEIWISSADGSSPSPITTMGFTGTPVWSLDGRRIAFVSPKDGDFDIYVVDAGGGFPKNLTENSFGGIFPSWSPDGRYIYYESRRNNRRSVFRLPTDGGEPELVLAGAYFPKMARDGTLFFSRQGTIHRLRPGETEPTPLLERFGSQWVPWRDQVVLLNRNRDSPSPPAFEVLDPESGTLTTLVELEPNIFVTSIDVSPDGQWIYYDQRDTAGSDIMLVENFTVDR